MSKISGTCSAESRERAYSVRHDCFTSPDPRLGMDTKQELAVASLKTIHVVLSHMINVSRNRII